MVLWWCGQIFGCRWYFYYSLKVWTLLLRDFAQKCRCAYFKIFSTFWEWRLDYCLLCLRLLLCLFSCLKLKFFLHLQRLCVRLSLVILQLFLEISRLNQHLQVLGFLNEASRWYFFWLNSSVASVSGAKMDPNAPTVSNVMTWSRIWEYQ